MASPINPVLMSSLMGGMGAAGAAGTAPTPSPTPQMPGPPAPTNPLSPPSPSVPPFQPPPPPPVSEEVKVALKYIVDQIKQMDTVDYRRAIRKGARARAYWKGIHYGWASETQRTFIPSSSPTFNSTGPNPATDEEPRFEFVNNMYQATVMIVVAALISSGVPPTAFLPVDPDNDLDISSADAYDTILKYIERTQGQNHRLAQWIRLNWLLCTDGVVVGYQRHLRDGYRYGYTMKPVVAMQPRTIGAGAPGADDEAQTVDVPVTIGNQRVPKGFEKRDLYGIIETRLPSLCSEARDCPYIGIENEVYLPSAKAAYPDIADKLSPSGGDGGDGSYLGFRAREMSTSPVDSSNNSNSLDSASRRATQSVITYGIYWLRPEMFWMLSGESGPAAQSPIRPDMIRQQLMTDYPDGVRLELLGDTFATAVPERLDDHIRICHAMPGDGMFTPAIAESYLDIQDLVDTATNLRAESMEFAAFPPVLYDSESIDAEAITNKRMAPATYTPMYVKAGKTLQNSIYQVELKEQSSSVDSILQMGMQSSTFLTGAQPALAGGSEQGMRTKGQYAQARSQALQRLSIPFQNAKTFWSEMDLLTCRQFVQNSTDDKISFASPNSKTTSAQPAAIRYSVSTINMLDAKGECASYPESSDSIPSTLDQKREAFETLLESQNPHIQQVLADPNNIEWIAELFSIPELHIEGRNYRTHVLRTIREMLGEKVQQSQSPAQPQMPSQPGQPPAPPAPPVPPAPSRSIDPFLDDPAVIVKVCRDWLMSRDGIAAQQQNPDGYQNVLAYAHSAAQMQQQQAQQQMQQQIQQQGQQASAVEQPKIQGRLQDQQARLQGEIQLKRTPSADAEKKLATDIANTLHEVAVKQNTETDTADNVGDSMSPPS